MAFDAVFTRSRALSSASRRVAQIIALVLPGLLFFSTAQAQPVENRGRYIAAAADCMVCHTAENGRPFAGGRAFPTPFGTLYSTNITPDKKTGIGNFTLAEFRATMRRGKGPHGNLYPAMPYTSYYLVRDEDIEALYTYFMALPPVENQAPQNRLIFPANLRFGLSLWNWLFFDPDRNLSHPQGKSPEWQRGNYLVNALGHCGECHTPRNFAQALQRDRHFAGHVLEGWNAVDIRPQALRRQGWSREQLRQLFTTGGSERGTVFGEMFRVVQHSLRHLSDEDIDAIITYLLDESRAAPTHVKNPEQAAREHPRGRQDFIAYCAGCHGRAGSGVTLAFAPGLDNNSAVRALDPYNTIAVILRGLPAQRLDRSQARAGMPSFHRYLSDTRIAELVNFMRVAWGSDGDEVTAEEVARIRNRLKDDDHISDAATGNRKSIPREKSP